MVLRLAFTFIAMSAFALACVFISTPTPYSHCQSSVSAFQGWGSVEVRKQVDGDRVVFVGSDREREKVYPLIDPQNLDGEANYLDAPIDRIEIAKARSFHRDLLTTLSFIVDVARDFEAREQIGEVGSYKFDVIATVHGAKRNSFSVGSLRPLRKTFWSFRPPTEEDARLYGNDKRVTVLHLGRVCANNYGFRLNRPAVFYWRGGKLAAVADISPEAMKVLKVGLAHPPNNSLSRLN